MQPPPASPESIPKPSAQGSYETPPYSPPPTSPTGGLPQDLFGLMRDMIRQIPEMVRPQVTQYIYGGQFGAAYQSGQQTVSMDDTPTEHTRPASASPSAPVEPQTAPVFNTITDVETWFFSLPEEGEVTFEMRLHVLVMAVFSGNSQRFVEMAKSILRDKLKQGDEFEQTPESAPVFHRRLSDVVRLTGTRAETLEQGDGLTQAYRFNEAHYQLVVLQFLSTSPDLQAFREHFQAWLRFICTQSDHALIALGASLATMTRIQAAIGLGEFAKHDYQYYFNTLIKPWSEGWFGKDHTLHRITVLGWVLFQLATDSRYTDHVYELVTHWASLTLVPIDSRKPDTLVLYRKHLSLIWTATLIINMLGLLDMGRTMPIITQLAAQRVPNQSVFLLFPLLSLYSTAAQASLLLDLFADWQRQPHDNPANISRAELALRYFLYLMGSKTQQDQGISVANQEPASVPQDAHVMAQVLLRRAGKADQLIQATIWDVIQRAKQTGAHHPEASLEYLIKCVLRSTSGSIVDQMIELLGSWIHMADQRADLRPNIAFILREVKRDQYGYRVMTRLCQSRSFAFSPTAQALLRD
jgi:hypothetical protein